MTIFYLSVNCSTPSLPIEKSYYLKYCASFYRWFNTTLATSNEFDDLIILIQKLTPSILGRDNKARDDASRPYDVGGTFMDLIDGKDNDIFSNGLKISIFLTKT